MFIWRRALATVPLSPLACTLYWCRIGNVKFCLSPLLSSLVCETLLVFSAEMVCGFDDSFLMTIGLSTSSAEAAWHAFKPVILQGYWQLRSVP